jgi:hypothetical protein
MSDIALHSIHSAKSISIFLTYSAKWKSAQKTQGAEPHIIHQPTAVLNKKLEEESSPTGQIVYPNGAKTLYKGNREMSDKSRNRL